MKKTFTIIIIAIIFLFTIFVLRGSEDSWLCTTEGWVKHGVPSAPMPTTGCNDEEPSVGTLDWEIIKSAINNCEVKMVFQTHALEVSVDLKDGRVLKAVEPKIDDIINIAEESQKKCGKFPIGTE